MARLVKIGFPCNTLAVRLGLRPYVYHVMTGHTFFDVFQGEPQFPSIVRLFSDS
jgi:hypothetical protein